MKETYIRLMAIGRRLWRPWSADRNERESSEAIASVAFVLWLACVPIAAWMAVGDVPGLLAGVATMYLWVLGLLYFFCVEFPVLMLRFGLIWIAGAPGWTGVDEEPGSEQEREARCETRNGFFEQLRAIGVLPPDCESPPGRVDEIPDYLSRNASFRPTMQVTVKIAGVILILALIAGHQPMLATFYAVPSLGWFLVEWLRRRLPQGQSA